MKFIKATFGLLFIFICTSSGASNVEPLDLSPAKWIWYPSERTLQNTFILFRKEVILDKEVTSAKGWIIADSRYQLFVNGKRVQWGPAPADPRWQEADPVDLAEYLHKGENVIGCQVLFYGAGDGTSPIGKPGFLFKLNIDGIEIISDNSWKSFLARSWTPGKYKRWYLRSLQEEFDARLFPYGWDNAGFTENSEWVSAMQLRGKASETSVSTGYGDYLFDVSVTRDLKTELYQRSIPLMVENDVKAKCLAEAYWINWKKPAENYFDMKVPDSFDAVKISPLPVNNDGKITINPDGKKSVALTFEFVEQSVGWPYFTIDAPEGTVVELLVHEAHKPGNDVLINTHFNSWTRFICKEGTNSFSPFDFESLRWVQIHIRNFSRPVTISNIGLKRRQYNFGVIPHINISDPVIQKVMDAEINTLYNCAQDIIVDGMARERQQYSGDCSHQLKPLYMAFIEYLSAARFIRTYSQGITKEGYFADCWPAYDRLARMMEREVDLTEWGPLLDHGTGLILDTYDYYVYTGDKEPLKEAYPRFLRFFDYLKTIVDKSDGLLKVDSIGIPAVWIDHSGFKNQQRNKQLSFNLYVVAMCRNALSRLCVLFGDNDTAEKVNRFSDLLLGRCVKKFWSKEERVFIDNLPWLKEDRKQLFHDRSLSTALLFHLCPGNDEKRTLEILKEAPEDMGNSYPANVVWKYWALSENNEMQIVVDEIRNKWGRLPSVLENNTMQEFWDSGYDNSSQWSHCAVAPIMMLYQGLAGAKPLTPGGSNYRIWPRPCDLKLIDISIQTTAGPIGFKSEGERGKRTLTLAVPAGQEVELWLDAREKVSLPLKGKNENGTNKYRIAGGTSIKLKLKYT